MRKYSIERVDRGYAVFLRTAFAVVEMATRNTKKAAIEWARQHGFRISRA